jgi:hypothetical protein
MDSFLKKLRLDTIFTRKRLHISRTYPIEKGYELSSGKHYKINIHFEDLVEDFGLSNKNPRELVAIFYDQLGNSYVSEPFSSNIFF